MRYLGIVKYDGSNYYGFQRQSNLPTIQGELEKVLSKITKMKINIYGAGRTDVGVHALGQVFHFDICLNITANSLQKVFNSYLPKDIYVSNIENVNNDFHARFTPHKKKYLYVINNGQYNPLEQKYNYFYPFPLNLELMKEAATVFIGRHDFKSFTKNHHLENTIRTIETITITKYDEKIQITFVGEGFLHNMIRIIVAMLIEVGRQKKTIADLENILESKNRSLAPKLVPGNGLYLISIEYLKIK